eukprot:gene13808-15227_t
MLSMILPPAQQMAAEKLLQGAGLPPSCPSTNSVSTLLSYQAVLIILCIFQMLTPILYEPRVWLLGGVKEKIADILLTSSNEFSDAKLEAALILAGLTKLVGNARSRDLQDAIIGELIEALRNATEKEFLCD